MKGRIDRTLITADKIQEKVRELGARISRDYRDSQIFAVCLLKGSLIFTSDLIRQITVPLTLDVMRASSYGHGTDSSGSVKILQDLDADIGDKDVLVIEDIVDTGRTLWKTLDLLRFRKPRSLKVCSLLDKPSRRVLELHIDYIGFTIEDYFVVGYGLDYGEYHRELPYIGILDPEG